jgi:hypothetical protein
MKRNTWIVLGIFVVLLAAVVALRQAPRTDAPQKLTLPALEGEKAAAGAEGAPLAGAQATDATAAITRISVRKKGAELVLERKGGEEWAFTQPKPARVDEYKVKAMLTPFLQAQESLFATRMKDDQDLRYYGLDADERVEVKLFKGAEEWLALTLGHSEKSDDEGYEKDTFVQHGGDGWIYRIPGKDLREPFDKGFDDLRSKKLFAFKREDVVEVRVHDPQAARFPDVLLRKDAAPETPQSSDSAKASSDKEERWTLVTPAGFGAEPPTNYLSTVANLYVAGFADAAPEGAGLDEKAYTLALKLADGTEHVLKLGNEQDGNYWAQVQGWPEFVKISKYTGKSLKRGAFDFRDKKVMAFQAQDVTRLAYVEAGAAVEVTRAGQGWELVKPLRAPAGREEVDKALKDAASFVVDTYLPEPPPNSESGLNDQAARFVLDTADGGHVEVLLGAEKKGEGKAFGKLLGRDEVFLATTYNLGKLKKKPNDLRRHAVLDLELPAISRIELIHPDERLTLEKKAPQGTPPDQAEAKAAWTVTSAPLPTPDQADLDGIAPALAALKAKDFVSEADAKKIKWDKAFQAKVTTGDGRTFAVTVSDDKQEGDSYARCDSPAWKGQVFTLQAFQVNKFKKKLHELGK